MRKWLGCGKIKRRVCVREGRGAEGGSMYDTIFFDLDGTLTDSAPGILNAVRFALEG